jgi:ribose-phosphate pyrophosphokinase
MTPLVVAYPGNEKLAESLRRLTGGDALGLSMRTFPDTETYLRVEGDVHGRTIVVGCTLHEPDSRFLPLAFLADTLRELGAASIGLAAPYLAYMRQDRRFQAGEALTSESFARRLSAQFDWLVTVDPHLHRRRSLSEIYSIPTAVGQTAPLLTRWIREEVASPVVIGPDEESEQWVRAVAGDVPCPYVVLTKARLGDREVKVSGGGEISRHAGRTPVLVDDIISSAQTMIEAIRQCSSAGLEAPVCLGVHAVFGAGAYASLHSAGAARIVTTNTVPHESNAIDIAEVLAAPVGDFVRREEQP